MKEKKRKCLKCGSTPEDSDVVLHRFPRPGVTNALRCELWAKFLYPDKQYYSTEFQKKIYSEHHMLCDKHFDQSSFIDATRKKMHRHAVPAVNCEEARYVQTDDTMAAGPSHAVLPVVAPVTEDAPKQPGVGLPIQAMLSDPSDRVLMDITTATTNESKLDIVSVAGFLQPKTTHPSGTMAPGSSRPTDEQIGDVPVAGVEKDKKIMNKKEAKHNFYYLKCRKYMKKICQLRNITKKWKDKYALQILAEDDSVRNLEKKISPIFALLLQAQIRNFSKKPKGRRWTAEDKIIALRLYKRSPTCYRLLRRLFCLPAPSALKKLLGQFDLPPGINVKVLKTLRKFASKNKPSDNEFILMFDEMSIKKHLQYNKKNDVIDGFQDHGNHGRVSQEACKAFVFMLAGIRKPVKQPLAYYLSGVNVTADRTMVLIKETIRACFSAGLCISATVCDMGGTNRKALAALGATPEHPVIKLDNKEVITLFDAPHLLKCFRNMFLKYDIKCKADISSGEQCGEGLAKWSDIRKLYEVDSTNPNFVMVPHLKKEHLDPNTKQKMKVNLAAQVLSHTVAVAIFSKVAEGKLRAGAVVTANLIGKMDKLFDLVNSDTPDQRRGKPHATNISNTSPHSSYFQKMKLFFKDIQFVGCPRPPPSIEGWIWTLNGIEMLWNKIKKHGDVQSLATRRLQQDPLENLFGCIRGNCGSNVNPTTAAFIGGMKTAIMSNLTSISSGNCERDSNVAIIENFKILLSSPVDTAKTCIELEDSSLMPLFQSSVETSIIVEKNLTEEIGEIQACAYVCGFLVRNNKIVNKCEECKNIFETAEPEMMHSFVENREYYDEKKCLKYASHNLVECVEKCATIINAMITKDAYKNDLKKIVLSSVNDNLFNFLANCSNHFEVNKTYIKGCVFHICVNRFCTLRNRSYAEDASRSTLKKKIDILKHK